jgi:hypothetical protein
VASRVKKITEQWKDHLFGKKFSKHSRKLARNINLFY